MKIFRHYQYFLTSRVLFWRHFTKNVKRYTSGGRGGGYTQNIGKFDLCSFVKRKFWIKISRCRGGSSEVEVNIGEMGGGGGEIRNFRRYRMKNQQSRWIFFLFFLPFKPMGEEGEGERVSGSQKNEKFSKLNFRSPNFHLICFGSPLPFSS